MTDPTTSQITNKLCGSCINKMIKNPDMICKVMPGHKACMFCKEKNLRCFQVPQEYDAELKALIAAKRDYDLEHSETTSLRVKAQAEKLHELVAQAMANTPKRSRRSKDLTADELTEKARTESPLKRSTRQRRGRSGTRAIMLDDDGDDNDHDMEEQPPSPRAQPALGTRNLFGSIESRRPPVTVAAEKPLDVNLASSAELNRKLDELLQINTWTMRKSRAMAQSLMNLEGTMAKLLVLFQEDIKLRKEDLALRKEESAVARAGLEKEVLPLRMIEKRQREDDDDGEEAHEEENPERKKTKHGENDEGDVMMGESLPEQVEEGLEEGEIAEEKEETVEMTDIVTLD
ncbi:hypothetical protein AAP_06194 [Ascosphaera apis ARSEF 7405]|uniref:Uncharacterized protein n=1 Tax=Ascosphaera apis ARSEF 7405 TaxID=392613 RepID=A0A162IBY8_9EURO|nr:hypothetical protein AAP_06194 [Ascosphaera apis ARSEF 7405]